MSAVVIRVANNDCWPSRNSTLLNFKGTPAPAKSAAPAPMPSQNFGFLLQNKKSRPFVNEMMLRLWQNASFLQDIAEFSEISVCIL